jgi:hypothetical protein
MTSSISEIQVNSQSSKVPSNLELNHQSLNIQFVPLRLDTLQKEIALHLISFLRPAEACFSLARVNKQLNKMTMSRELWAGTKRYWLQNPPYTGLLFPCHVTSPPKLSFVLGNRCLESLRLGRCCMSLFSCLLFFAHSQFLLPFLRSFPMRPKVSKTQNRSLNGTVALLVLSFFMSPPVHFQPSSSLENSLRYRSLLPSSFQGGCPTIPGVPMN